MKAYNSILLAATLAAAILLSSCKESFLDSDPLSFYEPETTFSTESGLKSVLATCDRHLRNWLCCGSTADIVTPIYSTYMHTDIAVAGKTDQSSIWADPALRLTPSNGLGSSGSEINQFGYLWSEAYVSIREANTITNYAGKVEDLDEDTRNAYLGRGYFHQAYNYLNLVFMFKDIPLVTKLIESPKFDYKSTSRTAILELMTQNMEKAVAWVPDQEDMDELGMVNKAACRMLLSKYYLSTGQWTKAEAQLDTVINYSGYALMTETFGTFVEPFNTTTWPITRNVIWDLHRPENKLISANTEGIYTAPNTGTGSSNSFVAWYTIRALGVLWDYSSGMPDPNGKQAVVSYSRANSNYNEDLDYTRAIGRGTGYLRPTHYAQHEMWLNDEGDLRHSTETGNWVKPELIRVNNPSSSYYGEYLQQDWCTDTIRCWFGYPHYKIFMLDYAQEEKTSATNFRGASSSTSNDGCANWYIYRLAEAYLLRAEARFYQGDTTGAAEDLNVIRERAHCDVLFTTATIGDIMDERARELYMEEWRYPEMSRVSYCLALSGQPDEWGNTYDPDTYDMEEGLDEDGGSYWWQRIVHYNDFYNKNDELLVKSHYYTIDKHNLYLPIPQTSIDANRKGTLRQNYGYDGYDDSIEMWENWEDAVADEENVES